MESKAALLAGEKNKKRDQKITNSIRLVFSLCLYIYIYISLYVYRDIYMCGLRYIDTCIYISL